MQFVSVSALARVVVAAGACAYGVAQAQDAQTLETIEVTDSQATAQSVDVLDAPAIAEANLREIGQLQDQVPNLRIGALGGRATQSLVSLRGYTNPYGAPESAAVVYVDGVPINDFYFFNQPLLDVERVEVHKGPQGSAYGMNSEAGVIDIVTRKPDATLRAFADASVQSRNGYDLDAGASGALGANVFGSLAAAKDGGAGYIDNLAGNRNYNGRNGANLRGRLVWQPGGRTEIDAMVMNRHVDDGGGEIYLPVDRVSFNRLLVQLGGSSLGNFEQDIDHEGYNRLDATLGALSGSWKGDAMNLRATASWRSGHARNSTDYDLTPLPWFYMDSAYRVHADNLELRAESSAGTDAPWTWLGGFSVDHRDFDFLRTFHIGPGNPWQYPVGDYPRTDALLTDRTLAAFGQSTWRFDEARRWGVTAGLRLERADRAVDFRANAIDPGAARLDHADSQALPRLSLDYRITPRQLAYVSVARGWKPGGYNTNAFSAALTQFRPEVTTALEMGIEGDIGGAFNYSLAAFDNRIHDYQDLVITEADISSIVVNAKRASTRGMEARLAWHATGAWQLGATAGTVRAVYDDDLLNPATGFRLDGHRLQNVPRWNYNLHARFTSGPWFARGEIAGAGSFEANAYNSTSDVLHEQQVPGYNVLNARIGYRGTHWSTYLYGSNLGNRRYFLSAGFGFGALNGYTGAVGNVAPPRTLGVQVRWEH